MLYIPSIDDYLKNLTDGKVKDVAAINFSESIREEQKLRKVPKSLYIYLKQPGEVHSNYSDNCMHHCNVEILNLFHPVLILIKTKSVIRNTFNGFLSEQKNV